MQIREIRIRRFGPWRDASVQVPESTPLAVLIGGNESGKSMLRRFIRWVLWGDPPAGTGSPAENEPGDAAESPASCTVDPESSALRSSGTIGTAKDAERRDAEAERDIREGWLRVRFAGQEFTVWRCHRDGREQWDVCPAREDFEVEAQTVAPNDEPRPRGTDRDVAGKASGPVVASTAEPGCSAEQPPAPPADVASVATRERPGPSAPAMDSAPGEHDDAHRFESRRLREWLSRAKQNGIADACVLDLFSLAEREFLADPLLRERLWTMELPVAARAVLWALRAADEEIARIWSGDGSEGRLPEAFEAFRQACLREHSWVEEQRRRRQVVDRWRATRAELRDAQRRRDGLEHQLRGHRLLNQAWPLWKREQEILQALRNLPAPPEPHEDALRRFRQIRGDLEDVERRLRETRDRLRQVRAEYEAVRTARRRLRFRPVIERLVQQAEQCASEREDIAQLRRRIAETREKLENAVRNLGPRWTVERIERLNFSWGIHVQLLHVARDYEGELGRQQRLRRCTTTLDRRYRREAARLQEACRRHGAETIREAIDRARRQLAQVRQKQVWATRLRELEGAREQLIAEEQRVQLAAEFPRWMQVVLGIFVAAGAFAVVAGLVTSLSSDWLAGLGYVFLGLTSGAMAWAWKRHVESEAGARWERLHERVRSMDRSIAELRGLLDGASGPADGAAMPAAAGSERATQDAVPPPHEAVVEKDAERSAATVPQDGPEPERPQPRRAAADDPEIAEADREIERLTQVLVELEALQERQRRVVVLRRRLR
ncbi:MAG: hypothetical protein D6725_15415, partial [Planctomycetota bacterium]